MSTTTREQLEKLVPELKAYGDELQAKDSVPTTEELSKLTEMTEKMTNLVTAVKANAAASGSMDVANAFLASLADQGAAVDQNEKAHSSGIVNPKGMTLGEAFSKSPAYQEFLGQFKGNDGAIRNVPISKAADYAFDGVNTKTPIFGLSDTSAGAFVQTQRLGGTTDLIGMRRLTVADLCTHVPVTGDTFDYVTVTTKTNNAAPVLEATTSATPGLNNVAVGAYTAAHGVKPESALAFAVVSSIIETIAHLIPISRRAAADAPQVRAMVDEFLLYGIQEELEDQILNGNGTTPQLRGILNVVGINTVGSAGTDLDAIVAGIAAIREDNREPTAMVVHPNDWYSTGFLLAKDTAGNYLVANPGASIDQMMSLWGLRVVVTPAMTENTVLVGDFRQAVVADRQQGTIYVTDSHNDWFARNLLAILGEARYGFGVLDPEAFCTVTAV